ncbi:MAG: type II toxin-antitoxin system Phd/YefM family antitoxin [Deltaproteobacteria bacterium]|nr:type II toxin-antitoxin system Phd/YefM family antitoxin [Deltaproteobacteria bacterium]
MVKRISAKDARAQFSEILGMVHFGKEAVIVEKQGKPMVAIVDIELYERWQEEREIRFGVLDEIRSKGRRKRPEEIERDVAEAVSEVRASARQIRGKRAQGGR